MEKVVLAIIIGILLLISIPGPVRSEDVHPPPSFDVEIIDYPKTIEPGGSYYIVVRVTRPSGMPLPAWTSGEEPSKWEVRVYFYSGLNCYNEGERVMGAELYDGWWKWRKMGDNWTENMPDTREFEIRVEVVDYPRPAADEMADLPLGEKIRLRAKMRIRWGGTGAEFEDIDGDNKSELLFTYNGVRYGGDYQLDEWGQNFRVENIILERRAGFWLIDFQDTVSVEVAGSKELPPIIWIGPLVAVVVAAVAAIFLKKKRMLSIKKLEAET